MNDKGIIRLYIERNGTRFAVCGCLVWRQAYITFADNASRPGRLPGWRVRCRKHHRAASAASMRKQRETEKR